MTHPAAPPPDPARVRAVLDIACALDAPPEALGWLLRLSREAEARRAAGAAAAAAARGIAPPLLPLPPDGDRG